MIKKITTEHSTELRADYFFPRNELKEGTPNEKFKENESDVS